MIRFILTHRFKLDGFEQETFETVDIDLPELEIKFCNCGRGDQGRDFTSLVGIEIVEGEKL